MKDNDHIWIMGDPVQFFKDACEHAGGQGATCPPEWRLKEIEKENGKSTQLI